MARLEVDDHVDSSRRHLDPGVLRHANQQSRHAELRHRQWCAFIGTYASPISPLSFAFRLSAFAACRAVDKCFVELHVDDVELLAQVGVVALGQ